MNGTAAVRNSLPDSQSTLAPLVRLSARVGRDPLLVQASSGNTSIKLEGVLWIKASGKWMADADRYEMFVPVSLAEAREQLERNMDLVMDSARSAVQPTRSAAQTMSASIETFMHAVVPHRVVVHVHSVNTIAWAVRQDAPSELAQRLSGLCWHWIPY